MLLWHSFTNAAMWCCLRRPWLAACEKGSTACKWNVLMLWSRYVTFCSELGAAQKTRPAVSFSITDPDPLATLYRFWHTLHCNCLLCCVASECVLTTILYMTMYQVRPSLSCYVSFLAAYISLESGYNCEHSQVHSSATNTSKQLDTRSASLCVQQCGAMTSLPIMSCILS